MNTSYQNIDDYIAQFDENTQNTLQRIRKTIQAAAPEAKEAISYGMPTFKYLGNLVHFAAYKSHFGFYPASAAIEKFKPLLTDYQTSKGTIQFAIHQEIPYDLIAKITTYRRAENIKKEALKKSKKKADNKT